jgi:hypothetical protein
VSVWCIYVKFLKSRMWNFLPFCRKAERTYIKFSFCMHVKFVNQHGCVIRKQTSLLFYTSAVSNRSRWVWTVQNVIDLHTCLKHVLLLFVSLVTLQCCTNCWRQLTFNETYFGWVRKKKVKKSWPIIVKYPLSLVMGVVIRLCDSQLYMCLESLPSGYSIYLNYRPTIAYGALFYILNQYTKTAWCG